jgi:hypothetical protein
VDHFNFTAEEVRKGWVGRAAQGIRPAAFHYCYLTWIADILTLPDLPFATTQVSSKLVRLTREPSFRQSVARLRDLNLIGSGPASRAADVIESELVVASSHLLRPIESVTPWWVANFTCVVVALGSATLGLQSQQVLAAMAGLGVTVVLKCYAER